MAWQGYKVISKLGEGGMATVYKAIQESLQRPVAIKILAANLKDHPEMQEMFESESLIIARLNHPHIIHVIDRGVTSKGRPYFVMEFVEGLSLEEAINRDKLDYPKKLDVLVQICKALAYAHKNKVIHRDIKPGNIMIDQDQQARVLDFGIAHLFDKSESNSSESSSILGTNAYMAPELHRSAENASVQSDLFALGILMYELFTGVQPQGDIPPPTQFEPELPLELNNIIVHCLAEEPEDRPSSADDVKNVLLHLLRGGHLRKDQKAQAEQQQPGVDGKFELLDVLKEDRNNSVYLYEDASRQKLIIVKKLPPNADGMKEQKLLTRLRHDHIVQVMGVSCDSQHCTLVTEYLSGGSLAEQLLAPVDSLKAMSWGRQMAEALVFAHKNRITHGNLRPGNVLFDEYGSIKLSDFGLQAHYHNSEEVNWYEHPSLEGAQGDLFALGAILFHAVTGKPPQFRSGQLMRSRAFSELPERVQEVLGRLLAAPHQNRYPTTEVVVAELRGVLQVLADQAEQNRKLEVKKSVAEVAKAEQQSRKEPFPWGRWIFRLILLAIVVEEVILGYGWKTAWPYLQPWLEEARQWVEGLKQSDSYIEWSDKSRKLLGQ